MKEYKYQAFMWRSAIPYRFKFYAETKALATDHARTVARQEACDMEVIVVKRLPSNSDMTDAGQLVSLC